MSHILKEWNGQRGEQVFARVELHDWLAGDWAEKVFFYTSQKSAVEIKAFVQGLVARAETWDD